MVARKRCKIGGKLVLITNRKSYWYMSFRSISKSVTLKDLERRNRPYFCVISPNSVASAAQCVKVVEDVVVKSSCSPSHLLMSFLFTMYKCYNSTLMSLIWLLLRATTD